MNGTELKQRLAAIVAADVAGYSRLMAADERATVAALDAARATFRTQIESNQGRVIDMAGDSVLAVFETATGAVSAALTIQQELNASSSGVPEDRRMNFRIGVHLGDIIEKSDGTVYGDGVNIAARLQALAEVGGVTVSDSVRNAVKGKASTDFQDMGEQQVKNISEPVRVYRVRAEGATPAQSASVAAVKSSPSRGEIDLSLPDKPSIAVLPFTNMSGDPEQEYFTDGVSEDIITELSRFHSLFVIARNSSFTYKGNAVDVKQIGRELGVRYVLEGSIRRAGNRIRVTAQLIDALSGNHIWAEKYDRVLEDIFAVQEELTQAIVVAIAPQIDAAERDKARLRRPESLSAYEIAVRAWAHAMEAWRKTDRSSHVQALEDARAALAIDPRSALALNALAHAHSHDIFLGMAPDREAAWQEGMAAATRAIEVDPMGSVGYSRKAFLLLLAVGADRIDEARITLRRGYEINPNDLLIAIDQGLAEIMAGNPQAALDPLHRALRISPRDPEQYQVHLLLLGVHLALKDYASALHHFELGLRDSPEHIALNMYGAMAHVGLGNTEYARIFFEKARLLAPEFIRGRLDGSFPIRSPEIRQRFIRFLRIAAGLEDPSAADALR